ncbi:MAG TPA: 50S ribosomal protein L11 methyltransferase [Candidatus Binataceae bacterium]|nr:50S ribosomal protein L11 methyltransferase [Candidatus Binataceae bacterium]
MTATYAKATFRVPAMMADDIAGFLISRGALGCAVAEMEKPRQRPHRILTLEAYFPIASRRQVSGLYVAMRHGGMLAARSRAPEPKKIKDPGWATKWQERFTPIHVGKKFLIVPPWDQKQVPGRITITIAPGFGFGTGRHPSTAGALRAIEKLFARRSYGNALDVGTGSGVLAFAMASLNARVTAIDIDQQALENARQNAKLNATAAGIRFSAKPPAGVAGRFDLITANILSTVLIGMASLLTRRLKPKGRLILSGILTSEVRQVLSAYRGLRTVAITRSRGWATLVMAK